MKDDRIVRMLPGMATTPKAFCGMLIEHAHRIKHIACVIQWVDSDGNELEAEVCSTEMPLKDAAFLKYVFNEDFPSEGM